jgi:chromosome segregation ATPase
MQEQLHPETVMRSLCDALGDANFQLEEAARQICQHESQNRLRSGATESLVVLPNIEQLLRGKIDEATADLRAQLEAQAAELTRTQQLLDETQSQRDDFRTRVLGFQEQVELLQAQDDLVSDLQRQVAAIPDLNAQISVLREDCAVRDARLGHAARLYNDLEAVKAVETERLQGEIRALEARMLQLEANAHAALNHHIQQSEPVQAQADLVSGLQRQVETIPDLNAQIRQLQAALQAAQHVRSAVPVAPVEVDSQAMAPGQQPAPRPVVPAPALPQQPQAVQPAGSIRLYTKANVQSCFNF